MNLKPELGYFAVNTNGKRQYCKTFEGAAFTAYHKNFDDVVEVYQVNVNGRIETRERNLTTASIDFLSKFGI
jgi:hypothetical protein